MKMNRIYIRNILISAVLIFLVIFLVLFKNRSPFGRSDSNFAPKSDQEITSVELSDENHSVKLVLTDGVWKVNGKTDARKSGISFLIKALHEIRIKSPVSPDLFENEIVLKEISPVRVKVYDKRKLLRSFYVYRTTSNRYGNIMKIRERSRPFIVHFPGYEGDIGPIFNPEERFWQPFVIFNLLPSEISSVTLLNNIEPSSSFMIKASGNSFQLSDTENEVSGWDTTKVKRYISYYTLVPFESLATDLSESEKAWLVSDSASYKISVTGKDGRITELELWNRTVSGKIDPDRLFGKTRGSEEYFIVRYFDIDPLLRKISYFFPEK